MNPYNIRRVSADSGSCESDYFSANVEKHRVPYSETSWICGHGSTQMLYSALPSERPEATSHLVLQRPRASQCAGEVWTLAKQLTA